jgi:hypothetical protein
MQYTLLKNILSLEVEMARSLIEERGTQPENGFSSDQRRESCPRENVELVLLENLIVVSELPPQ